MSTELSENSWLERVATYENRANIELFNSQWQFEISVLDDSTSILLYGGSAVILILLLTVSGSLAIDFYATRLKVSDQVIEEKTKTLAKQAVQDTLTGMLNRQALTSEVNERIRQLALGRSEGFSILFIDLDRFKNVNDSMGHIHGDKLLQQVAKRLVQNCRNLDISFRFGGDEFVICLPEQIIRHTLEGICKRYAHVLSEPYTIDGQTFHIGASIGVSIVTDPSQDLATILREADTAMYKAKGSSQEKIAFFHEQMFQQAKQRFALEQDITVALEQQELQLVYQPIYAIHNDEVSGFEALLRWQHPERGFIPPDKFIPIAEETGHIIKIGDWVVEQTCEVLETLWKDSTITLMPRININVSAKQFESQHIYLTLKNAVSRYSFPPQCIGVEITESLLLSSSECSAVMLEKIKSLGVTIYLDDFGTGYSSLVCSMSTLLML